MIAELMKNSFELFYLGVLILCSLIMVTAGIYRPMVVIGFWVTACSLIFVYMACYFGWLFFGPTGAIGAGALVVLLGILALDQWGNYRNSIREQSRVANSDQRVLREAGKVIDVLDEG